jgi:hypothetical protein
MPTIMLQLDYLILGAGWTSTFLIPLLNSKGLSYASTSTTGRDDTIEWKYDPDQSDPKYFGILPSARNIVIVFPLTDKGSSKRLTSSYIATHPRLEGKVRFMQLGSSGIYQIPDQPLWIDRHSRYDTSKPRAIAEDELLTLGGCVLNLSGLWGGQRHPRNWVDKVGKTKDQVQSKTSLHLVHGDDVAIAILAVFEHWDRGEKEARDCAGQRWLVTDGFVYDWWSLFARWSHPEPAASSSSSSTTITTTTSTTPPASSSTPTPASTPPPSQQSRWVFELMESDDRVKALPRSSELLGRCYDSREFWRVFGVSPTRAGL